jgi:hypothetical protein
MIKKLSVIVITGWLAATAAAQAAGDAAAGKANPIINGMVAALSDQDMENLAAYYASFK